MLKSKRLNETIIEPAALQVHGVVVSAGGGT